MAARLLLLIFLLQFYAPLVHAHPDGGALAGFAHLHFEGPAPHDHDVPPGHGDSITTEHHQVQTIAIGDASQQHFPVVVLAAVLAICLFVLFPKLQRWRKPSRLCPTSHQPSPPPNRAPPI
mgnify:CR=1 FL=1